MTDKRNNILPGNPVVLMTADTDAEDRLSLLPTYWKAVRRAGGQPFVVPDVADTAEAEASLRVADALVLTGGGDIYPAFYGESPEPGLGRVVVERDRSELALVRAAMRLHKPVLGICRGMQVINVALGGTIVQDMGHARGQCYGCHQQQEPTTVPTHVVHIRPATAAFHFFETERIATNSHHHQCIGRLAPGLKASGMTDDGVVEIAEHCSLPVFGVQFHPERMVESPEMCRFFRNWIAAVTCIPDTGKRINRQ